MASDSQRAVRDARLAGACWLICIVAGMAGFAATSPLIAVGDAASTAANIAANETRFRVGFVADLISGVSYVGVTGFLFFLLAPVDRSVSFVAACFGLCGVAIGGALYVLEFAPLVLLRGEPLASLSAEQWHALALAALKLRMQVFSMGMVLFGIQCLLVGWLAARSTFLPRILGVLLAIGGTSYVAISLLSFLAPSSGTRITPFFLPIALVGEGAMTFYLLVKGIRVDRWEQLAGVAALRETR